MINHSKNIESELAELCHKVIERLDKLKEDGKITEEQYQSHTVIKKQFIKYVKSSCNQENFTSII
ncbi:hypothetical protein [Petroclostridium sp. X23]|uniref:hypothetical protein n=1 Tax=Petroclostridium sp. X23 TaxID=3045146 RepID=UPI0024ACA779|nr:hypothetical protein [Petroclostridium sp. X23]WHH57291.1 hypothetical protein QKW49_15805 [Petroclostridium sp. X23]